MTPMPGAEESIDERMTALNAAAKPLRHVDVGSAIDRIGKGRSFRPAFRCGTETGGFGGAT
jgi:hypothetical protein